MADRFAKLGWLDKIVNVQWNAQGYLLGVILSTSPVLPSLVASAIFDDPDIGTVAHGEDAIRSKHVPSQPNMRIIDPPSAAMKRAYKKWRLASTIVNVNGEGGSTYQITKCGAYFDLTKLDQDTEIFVLNIEIGDLTGVDLVWGTQAQLFTPKGVLLSEDGTGSAGLPGPTAIIQVRADVTARTVKVLRPDD